MAKHEGLQTEELLQAVVLADSFDTKFAPITLEMPRSLLPLVNIPTIDYTLEFLASAGVQEIFVFCCWKAAQIQQYLSESRWTTLPNLIIRTVISPGCVSTGDALRAIYNLHIINSDFILVSGDVISNMKLNDALLAHKARRKQDKRSIMTVVLKQAAPNHRTRALDDDSVIVINPATGQLLHLENDRKQKSVNLDVDILKEHSAVQFRYDLLDCRIDICSPEVLQVCADNFDYDELRQDFIRGVVVDEVYKYKIYTHIITDEYAARINTLRTYASVSKDIIYRWTYPMVPDCNFMGDTSYSHIRNNIYKEENVKLARSCSIGRETVIGEGTEVGSNATITQSVIGRNCRIGSNVVIESSFIWDNVVIEDGAVLSHSLVCNEARILKNAHLQRGCIISFRAVVGADVELPACSKITTCTSVEDEDDLVEIPIGNGKGMLWVETDEQNQLVVVEAYSEDQTGHNSDQEEPSPKSELDLPHVDLEEQKWVSEVAATIRRAVEEGHNIDNLRLETKTLKLTFENRTFYELALVVLPTLLDIALQEGDPIPRATQLVRQWGPLMEGYLSSLEEQIGLILTLQKYCDENLKAEPAFMYVLHALYDIDVVEEDAVLEWAETQQKAEGPEKRFVQQSEKFLTWLKDAESEEEEDDEEEESDD